MQNTGIDFLITSYVDKIMVDKALVGLTANRDDRTTFTRRFFVRH